MTIEDILDLITNLLTLAAIIMVTLEKARPNHAPARLDKLKAFKAIVLASGKGIRRRVALIVAKGLKGTHVLSGPLGSLASPLFSLLRRRPKIQSILALVVVAGNGYFAYMTGSVWAGFLIPSVALFIVLLLLCFPAYYVMRQHNYLHDQINAGELFEHRGKVFVRIQETIPAHRLGVAIFSRVTPLFVRKDGYYGIRSDQDMALKIGLLPLIPACLCLSTIPAFLFDGFFQGPIWGQVATGISGIAVLGMFMLVPFLPWTFFFEQYAMPQQTLRQVAWSAPHLLRAIGPTLFITSVAVLTYGLWSGSFRQSGGGWFTFVNFAFDLPATAFTGFLLRDIIRMRGGSGSTFRFLMWVVFLFICLGGLKTFVMMLMSEQRVGIVDAYEAAVGFTLHQAGPGPISNLFWVAQTPCVFGAIFFVICLLVLSVNSVLRVIENSLGLAVSTLSPLEILATYISAFAALLAMLKSILKYIPGFST